MWDVESGRCVYTFDEEEEVEKVAFSPNGKQILYVLANRKVKIWDFQSLQELVEETKVRFKDTPLTPEEREEYYLY